MHCITLNVSLSISRAVNYVLLKWVPPALKQTTARLRFTQMPDIIAHLEKDRSTNVIDLCQRHDQYTTFPAAWSVVAGNTKLKATSSSSRERCCSQLTFQIRGRPATLCLRNLHSAALGSAVRQCATRTALVHEKCRVHESRNRNIGDFFRPSQSSIGPHATIFGLDFGAWLFSNWLNHADFVLLVAFWPPFVLRADQSLSSERLRTAIKDEVEIFLSFLQRLFVYLLPSAWCNILCFNQYSFAKEFREVYRNL